MKFIELYIIKVWFFLLISLGKGIFTLSRAFRFGSGTTLPGRILLAICPDFLSLFFLKFFPRVIVITGTNGKTTTMRLMQTILEENHVSVVSNISGANLLSGVVSCLIQHTTFRGKFPFSHLVIEIDEHALPLFIKKKKPDYLAILNLFRDQMDRYGETDTILIKWAEILKSLPFSSKVFLNADDPAIYFLGQHTSADVHYFGLFDETTIENQDGELSDIVYSPCCNTPLFYYKRFCAQLGIWNCPTCGIQRPNIKTYAPSDIFPTSSLFQYNIQAAYVMAKNMGILSETILNSFKKFNPSFGRLTYINYCQKQLVVLLSKNPISMSESFRTVSIAKGKILWLILNNRDPDGRDTSWIWDVDFNRLVDIETIIVSGDRAEDLQLRLHYALFRENKRPTIHLDKDIRNAFKFVLNLASPLFILPNYSALIELRLIFNKKDLLHIDTAIVQEMYPLTT